jgi:NAD(P)H-hydrate repair Nnr-like enzyme with NAD(P)H-hydrate epimerase domain
MLTPSTHQTLGPQKAAELDKELMSEDGGFSIDQLMELAGLSVSQAGEHHHATPYRSAQFHGPSRSQSQLQFQSQEAS